MPTYGYQLWWHYRFGQQVGVAVGAVNEFCERARHEFFEHFGQMYAGSICIPEGSLSSRPCWIRCIATSVDSASACRRSRCPERSRCVAPAALEPTEASPPPPQPGMGGVFIIGMSAAPTVSACNPLSTSAEAVRPMRAHAGAAVSGMAWREGVQLWT